MISHLKSSTEPTLRKDKLHAELRARLRELKAQLNGARPPERHPSQISAKQLAYLTDLLIQPNGRARYRAYKRALGISAPLGRLSKRQARLLIHYMLRKDHRP